MSLSYLQSATGQANKSAAIRDWQRAALVAVAEGKGEIVGDVAIDKKDGVKTIDKKTCKILKKLGMTKEEAAQKEFGCYYQWEKA